MKHFHCSVARHWLCMWLCMLAVLPAWAVEKEKNGIVYDVDLSTKIAKVTGVKDKAITSAIIPQKVYNCSVVSIEDKAFESCSSLTSVEIPNSVTSIGESTFRSCSSLTSVEIPNSVTSIGSNAFSSCNSLASVEIPNSVTSIGNSAFEHCSSLTSVEIPNSVTSIGSYAFGSCSSLTSVEIPSSVTSIGSYVFSSCSSLTSVEIPNSVTSVGEGAFRYCSSLTSVEIPNSVTSIGNSAFRSCSSLTSVEIPNSVTSIGDYAFSGCSRLSFVKIPASVRGIGNYSWYGESFSNCTSLSVVLFERQDNISILDNTFNNIATNPIAIVPDGSLAYYKGQSALSNFTIYEKGTINPLLTEKVEAANKLITEKADYYPFIPNDARNNLNNLLAQANKALSEDDNVTMAQCLSTLSDATDLAELYIMDLEDDQQSFLNAQLSTYYATATGYRGTSAIEGIRDQKLIVDASQLSSNAKETTEGSYEGLIDEDPSTYFHSTWSVTNNYGTYAFLQVDLRAACTAILLKYKKRQGPTHGSPKTLHIYVTNSPYDEGNWTDLGRFTCNYDGDDGELSVNLQGAYQYVRLVVEETLGNSREHNNLYFYWSELQAYSLDAREGKSNLLDEEAQAQFNNCLATAKAELDAGKATQATIDALKDYISQMDEAAKHAVLADFAKSEYITAYSNMALTVPEGVDAAVVVSDGSNGIRTDFRYTAGSVIPAQTGVLIKGKRGGAHYLREAEDTQVAPTDNLLHGTQNDETTYVEGASKYYKLSYDKATGTEIGFYWGAADGGAFTNKAGKAYLALPAEMQAAQLAGFSLFDLDHSSITGIDTVTSAAANTTFKAYDMNGRIVNATSETELPHGMYIVNGKKIMK